jgi:hypothetical protein
MVTCALALGCSTSSASAHSETTGDIRIGGVRASGPGVSGTISPDARQASILFDALHVRTDGAETPGVGALSVALSVPIQSAPERAFFTVMLRGEVIAEQASCAVHLSVNGVESSHSYRNNAEVALSSSLELSVPGNVQIAVLGACSASREGGSAALLSVDSIDMAVQIPDRRESDPESGQLPADQGAPSIRAESGR